MGSFISGIFFKGKRPLIWIAAFAALIYFHTIFFGFVDYDDITIIAEGPLTGISKAFTTDVFAREWISPTFYRPLMTLSLLADSAVWGRMPMGYHLTNILLHMMAGMVFFLLLKRLGVQIKRSFLLSLLFVSNPLAGYAVSWVMGRNDIILAIFVMASAIWYLKYLESGKGLFAHALFFAAAMFTKETALMSVPVFLFISRKSEGSKRSGAAVIWLAVLAFWLAMRWNAGTAPLPGTAASFAAEAAASVPTALSYLYYTLFPAGLDVFMKPELFPALAGFIAAAAGFALVSRSGHRENFYTGAVWAAAFILPTLFFNTFAGTVQGQRAYLPLAGLLIAASSLDLAFIKGRCRNVLPVMTVALWASLAISFSSSFAGSRAFWTSAVEGAGDHPAVLKYAGNAALNRKDPALAEMYYLKSLMIDPGQYYINNNLGRISLEKGDLAGAKAYFAKETLVNPGYDAAHYNLGAAYYLAGEKEKALLYWKKMLETFPGNRAAAEAVKIAEGELK